jgi:hypothetical protein
VTAASSGNAKEYFNIETQLSGKRIETRYGVTSIVLPVAAALYVGRPVFAPLIPLG